MTPGAKGSPEVAHPALFSFPITGAGDQLNKFLTIKYYPNGKN
jgi:hypothetical protein